jgi:hypothetical protein
MSLREWFRDLLTDARPYVTQAEAVQQLRAVMADSTPPKVVYDAPERDESKPSCVHLYSDNDILAHTLKREKERQNQPRNVRRFIRTVNS